MIHRTLWLFREGRFFAITHGQLIIFPGQTKDLRNLYLVLGAKLEKKPLVVRAIFPIKRILPKTPVPAVIVEYDREEDIPQLYRKMKILGAFDLWRFDDRYARAACVIFCWSISGVPKDQKIPERSDSDLPGNTPRNRITLLGVPLEPDKFVQTRRNRDGSRSTNITCLGCGVFCFAGALIMALLFFLKVMF